MDKMDKLKPKLFESKKTGRINLSYMTELQELPSQFVLQVKLIQPPPTELDLRNCSLTSLPLDLAELKNLKVLKLNYNKFTEFPKVVCGLHKLQVLEMCGNQLTALDPAIGDLKSLKELDLSSNQISTLPPSFTSLASLVQLNLESNLLKELPRDLDGLSCLTKLDLSSNKLTALPDSIGKIADLTKLHVNSNPLQDVPASLGMLQNLRDFDCRYNAFDGETRRLFEEGIPNFMAHLQEEYQKKEAEELERRKPVGVKVGSYMQYRVKSEPRDCPPVRTGHTMTQVGSVTYVIGGSLGGQTKVNEVWAIDSQHLLWERVETRGNAPAARDGHAAVYDGQSRIFIFGGRNTEKKRLSDFYMLDLHSMVWLQPTVEGTPPAPREGASMAMLGGKVAVFGGHGSKQRFNDLYLLDTESWTWIQTTTTGSVPAPRQDAAVTVLGSSLYVHGGRSNFILDDLHVLEFDEMTWTKVPAQGRVPPPRHSHTICTHEDRLYLFGGVDEMGGQLFSLFYLDIKRQQQWDQPAQARASTSRVGTPSVSKSAFVGEVKTWVELQSELGFNGSRNAGFVDGKFFFYQSGAAASATRDPASSVGSVASTRDPVNTVGSAKAPQTPAVLDVYSEAPLGAFQLKPDGDAAALPANNKRARVMLTMHAKMGQLPPSFTGFSEKERRLLDHVENFRSLFVEHHPHRRPPFLAPRNECGVEKFLCTTLRPSQLPFTELYDWEKCARFVADFLRFDPLEDAREYPAHVPSPWSVFQWQCGDSFDFSIGLCSLLLGAGFDAYCVAGYAPKEVTTNDQSNVECPLLSDQDRRGTTAAVFPLDSAGKSHAGTADPKNRPSVPPPPSKYQVKELPNFESAFAKQQEERGEISSAGSQSGASSRGMSATQPRRSDQSAAPRRISAGTMRAQMAAEGLEVPPEKRVDEGVSRMNTASGESLQSREGEGISGGTSGDRGGTAREKDPLDRQRVHCWVMVAPGHREIAEGFFVEPSTGVKYALTGSPYHGIEEVWNDVNVWVNMQPNPRREGIADVSWDLKHVKKWERVLDDVTPERARAPAADDAGDDVSANSRGSITGDGSTPGTARRGAVEALLGKGTLGREKTPGGLAETLARGVNAVGEGGRTAIGTPKGSDLDELQSTTRSRGLTTNRSMTSRHGTLQGPIPLEENSGSEVSGRSGSRQKEEQGPRELLNHWMLPASWVPKLAISREAFDTRCLKGTKVTVFHRCTLEIFSSYGENARWDGLTQRISVFSDDARTILRERRECFQRRKDRLRERRSYPLEDKIHEKFDTGTVFGLKELISVKNVSRTMHFYPSSRLDGLLVREEVLQAKTVEVFEGRDDRLLFRKAVFGAPAIPAEPSGAFSDLQSDATSRADSPSSDSGSHNSRGTVAGTGPGGKGGNGRPGKPHKHRASLRNANLLNERLKRKTEEGGPVDRSDGGSESGTERSGLRSRKKADASLPIVKLTEKFASDPTLPANQNVAKRTFKLNPDSIKLTLHYADNRITASSRSYGKDGSATVSEVDPLAPRLDSAQLAAEYQRMLAAERAAMQAVRDSERETAEILEARAREEHTIVLKVPYYDVARVKKEESDDEDTVVVAKVENDYLSPFLPPHARAGQLLTRQEMLETREKCLRALKDRLIERANIIQARHDEETAALAKRQANFQRDRDQMTRQEEEEYEKTTEESMFRIHILEQRLKKHEEQALQKYYEMDGRLRGDPRLAGLVEAAPPSIGRP